MKNYRYLFVFSFVSMVLVATGVVFLAESRAGSYTTTLTQFNEGLTSYDYKGNTYGCLRVQPDGSPQIMSEDCRVKDKIWCDTHPAKEQNFDEYQMCQYLNR